MKIFESWLRLRRLEVFSNAYFKLYEDQCQLPDQRVMPRYFVMDFPDWVQVIALTVDKKLVLVKQYRYPVDREFIELPGGSTDPASKEDHLDAAKRELLEETGFESTDWQYIGFHYPNPALMTNRCHVYLALNCEMVSAQNLDPYEFIQIDLIEVTAFREKFMKAGQNHALMLASWLMVEPRLHELKQI